MLVRRFCFLIIVLYTANCALQYNICSTSSVFRLQKKAKTAALTNANKMRDELLAMDDDNVNDQV